MYEKIKLDGSNINIGDEIHSDMDGNSTFKVYDKVNDNGRIRVRLLSNSSFFHLLSGLISWDYLVKCKPKSIIINSEEYV